MIKFHCCSSTCHKTPRQWRQRRSDVKAIVQQITQCLNCESARNCGKDKYVNIRLHTQVVLHTQGRNFRHIFVNMGLCCGVNYFASGGALSLDTVIQYCVCDSYI
jgi:hypothetical protein